MQKLPASDFSWRNHQNYDLFAFAYLGRGSMMLLQPFDAFRLRSPVGARVLKNEGSKLQGTASGVAFPNDY